jgi:hypothetical protein
MGDVTSYAIRIKEILLRVADQLRRIPKPGIETLLIEDQSQSIILLARVGWYAGERVDNIVIFARIREGKVWIEEDNTDLTFADELIRSGVPEKDIVLAFHHPDRRHRAEFAVA